MECQYCGKICKNDNSKKQHEIRCKLNPNRISDVGFVKNRKPPWNKGLKNDIRCTMSDATKKKISDSLKNNIPWNKNKICPSISEGMKGSNKECGGYRKGSGRGKQGRYKGIWCDSSWELAWVIYHLDNNIKFEKNWKKFEYTYKKKKRYYMPDFYLVEDKKYIEIKGRRNFDDLDDINKIKIIKFKETLDVLYEQDIKKYIDYVEEKYGKDYVKMYETRKIDRVVM